MIKPEPVVVVKSITQEKQLQPVTQPVAIAEKFEDTDNLRGLETSGSASNTKTSVDLPFFELPAISGDKYAYHTVPVLNFPTAADIAKLIPRPPEADFGQIPSLIAPTAPVGLDVAEASSWPHADLGPKNRKEVFGVLGVNNILSPRQLASAKELSEGQWEFESIVPFNKPHILK